MKVEQSRTERLVGVARKIIAEYKDMGGKETIAKIANRTLDGASKAIEEGNFGEWIEDNIETIIMVVEEIDEILGGKHEVILKGDAIIRYIESRGWVNKESKGKLVPYTEDESKKQEPEVKKPVNQNLSLEL